MTGADERGKKRPAAAAAASPGAAAAAAATPPKSKRSKGGGPPSATSTPSRRSARKAQHANDQQQHSSEKEEEERYKDSSGEATEPPAEEGAVAVAGGGSLPQPTGRRLDQPSTPTEAASIDEAPTSLTAAGAVAPSGARGTATTQHVSAGRQPTSGGSAMYPSSPHQGHKGGAQPVIVIPPATVVAKPDGAVPTAGRPLARTADPQLSSAGSVAVAVPGGGPASGGTSSSATSKLSVRGGASPAGRGCLGPSKTTAGTIPAMSNAYTSILGEARDLLDAAHQAQQLGRLRQAASYQLLLHARLVGLGRRFDRACAEAVRRGLPVPQAALCGNVGEGGVEGGEVGANKVRSKKKMTLTDEIEEEATDVGEGKGAKRDRSEGKQQDDGGNKAAGLGGDRRSGAPDGPAHAGTLATEVAPHLAAVLPPNVEIDSDMMEHLARAAMELHNQRTGRGLQSEAANATARGEAIPGGVNVGVGGGSIGGGSNGRTPPVQGVYRSTTAPKYHYPLPPPGAYPVTYSYPPQMTGPVQTNYSPPLPLPAQSHQPPASVAVAASGSTVASSSPLPQQPHAPSAVAWTQAEKQTIKEAAAKFGSENIVEITKAVGTRSEAQVRAHLRNVTSREQAERNLGESTGAVDTAVPAKKENGAGDQGTKKEGTKAREASKMEHKVTGEKRPSSVAFTADSGSALSQSAVASPQVLQSTGASTGAAAGAAAAVTTPSGSPYVTPYGQPPPTSAGDTPTDDGPRRRGGRGKKPPPSAIHTVPNANFNARELLLKMARK